MNIKSFKPIFDKTLKTILDKKINQTKKFLNHKRLNQTIDYISTYIFSGGKRLRPYSVYLSYKLFGGKNDKEIIRFGAIFEILHAMLLIHDDIIDQANKRHNIASFHKYIETILPKVDNRGHIGEGQTIVVGDLMLSWVYEFMNQNFKFDNKSILEARQSIHEMIQEVILGQMIDIDMTTGTEVNEKLLYKKNLYKTARYTFARPLLIGSILAGAKKIESESSDGSDLIFKVGEVLGIAFQIRDDLKDILAQDEDKTMFSDIQQGQQTYFTQYVMKNGNSKQKKLLSSYMGKKLNKVQILSLQNLFDEIGAIEYGKKMIKKYCDEAKKLLKKLKNVDKKYLGEMEKLIELIK